VTYLKRKDFVNILDLAIEALEICNRIHERTGAIKVPLVDVAEEMGPNTTKKMIQDGFWILVDFGIIGDDGDEDHMNYDDDGNNELSELLNQIKIEELEKDQEAIISTMDFRT
jgi:hypothetical protein